MSNFLAIATVTAGLSDLLQTAILTELGGASVTTLPPDKRDVSMLGVNIFLYQVTPNAAWRNADLPTRRPNSDLVRHPRAALDLHYLLTVYGADGELEAQRVLGIVIRTLHSRPILTRDAIRATTANAMWSFLANSNLADDVELVRFTPVPLSLEELSKFWSITFQTPYRLSIAYQATVILIESEESTRAALPVRRRNLYAVPFRQIVVEDVVLADGSGDLIGPESTLAICGRHFRADVVEVHIGDAVVRPDREKVGDTKITIDLPAGLRAGMQGLQVVQPRPMGTPPVAHRGVSSNVAPFVLYPSLVGNTVAAKKVTATVRPRVAKTQRAALLLDEFDPPGTRAPRAFSFDAAPRKPEDPSDTDTLDFPFSGVPSGDYLARVQIDGAESALDADADPDQPRFTGPKVTIP